MLGTEPQTIRLADDSVWNSTDAGEQESGSDQLERQRPKVLVVDDQELIVDTITEILELYDFQAFAAYDGRSALELAEKILPDYLLTDVLMPEMNGMELAIAMRKLLPMTKILLFSGQAGISEVLLDGQQRGYEFDLVAKPIHPEKLVQILKNIQ
jgi:CheY-like chemotaxis protein